MPFDSSGNYSLPQAPFTPNTVISSANVNSNFSDIAAALTTAEQGVLALASSNVIAYQNRADAVAASIASTVNYVLLQGYTTAGDCDGLQLLFIRGTTPTQGSFVSADGQRWILQNRNPHVGMFGAVGDGTTDDSTAILNAIAFVKTNSTRGGTIWFSAKTYAVGTTITVGDGAAASASTYNGIILASMTGVGASSVEFTANAQGTIIKWIGAANGTAVKFAGPINSCGMQNICIYGNALTSKALYLSGCYKGRFDNVLITKYSQNNATDTGLYIDSVTLPATVTVGGDSNLFLNLQVEDAGNNTGRAVYITGSNYNQFTRGLIAIPGTGTAINIIGTASFNASFNTFENIRIPQQNTGTGTPVNLDATAGTVKDNNFLNCDIATSAMTTVNSPGNNPVNSFARPFPQGRITLTSATPVMISTVSGATTVYYTPYIGDQIPLYNGAMFVPTTFTEMSQATADATKSPTAVAASKNYDIFVWSDSGVLRATRGPAWSSDTVRGTGAGTTELQMINGILTNKVAITNGPGANRGTYVGTIRSNGSSTIDWIVSGSGSGGAAVNLYVWNCYNRVVAAAQVSDTGTTYTYSTGTQRQARASTNNQINYVLGIREDAWTASYSSQSQTTANIGSAASIGIGNCITIGSTGLVSHVTVAAQTMLQRLSFATTQVSAQDGYGFASMIELGDGTHSNTFDAGSDSVLVLSVKM